MPVPDGATRPASGGWLNKWDAMGAAAGTATEQRFL